MTTEEKYPDAKFGIVNVRRAYAWDDDEDVGMVDEGWELFLYHSCDEWVIGNLQDGKQFAKNLEQAIKYIESNP